MSKKKAKPIKRKPPVNHPPFSNWQQANVQHDGSVVFEKTVTIKLAIYHVRHKFIEPVKLTKTTVAPCVLCGSSLMDKKTASLAFTNEKNYFICNPCAEEYLKESDKVVNSTGKTYKNPISETAENLSENG